MYVSWRVLAHMSASVRNFQLNRVDINSTHRPLRVSYGPVWINTRTYIIWDIHVCILCRGSSSLSMLLNAGPKVGVTIEKVHYEYALMIVTEYVECITDCSNSLKTLHLRLIQVYIKIHPRVQSTITCKKTFNPSKFG